MFPGQGHVRLPDGRKKDAFLVLGSFPLFVIRGSDRENPCGPMRIVCSTVNVKHWWISTCHDSRSAYWHALTLKVQTEFIMSACQAFESEKRTALPLKPEKEMLFVL